MSVRSEYDKELKELHKSLLKMGAYIEQSMDDTMEAFVKQNAKLAEEVIARDDIIDDMELAIETECLLLITRQQPLAGDLRMIASILKIITDLERIADQCADISEITIKLSKHTYTHFIDEILLMADQVKRMIKKTIDTYVELDVQKAIATAKEDDIVDNYYEEIVEKIQKLMKDDPNFIEEGTSFMFIVKYLERMADHTTNICEWVAYRVTGNRQQYN